MKLPNPSGRPAPASFLSIANPSQRAIQAVWYFLLTAFYSALKTCFERKGLVEKRHGILEKDKANFVNAS